MKFRSGTGGLAEKAGSPGSMRLPSIRTRVRVTPRLRRSTVAVPVEPLPMAEPWPANACGRLLTRSSIRVAPVSLISALETVVTGLTAVRLADGIRVPVTTTSCTAPAAGAV